MAKIISVETYCLWILIKGTKQLKITSDTEVISKEKISWYESAEFKFFVGAQNSILNCEFLIVDRF